MSDPAPAALGLIGDPNPMNRRFLARALAHAGIAEAWATGDPAELLEWAVAHPTAAVVVDPAIDDVDGASTGPPGSRLLLELAAALSGVAVVVSGSKSVLSAARALGFTTARKVSFLDMTAIEAAVRSLELRREAAAAIRHHLGAEVSISLTDHRLASGASSQVRVSTTSSAPVSAARPYPS